VKIEFELPDDVFVAARKAADERRITLRDLLLRAVRRELAALEAERARIEWVAVETPAPSPDPDQPDPDPSADWPRRERRSLRGDRRR
jgi:hypothetical protein